MTISAARAGIGVALIPTFLIEQELREGSLVRLQQEPRLSGAGSYYVVVPVEKQHDAAVAEFVTWIVREAATSSAARKLRERSGEPPSTS